MHRITLNTHKMVLLQMVPHIFSIVNCVNVMSLSLATATRAEQ